MKNIILLLAALMALAGCTTSTTHMTGRASGGLQAFGTLASFGTFEMELAPAYTRLAVLRHNAARLLRDGRIDVGTAQTVQGTADQARNLLDAAHAETLDGKARPAARENLNNATALIAAAEKFLEARK